MAEDTTPAEGTTEATSPAAKGEGLILPAMGDENAADDWSPPQRNEQGFAVDGDGLPLNLRLRATALADSGKDEDPAGSVDAATIAAEKERLAEYDSRFQKVSANMKTADLEKVAKAEGVDLSAASNNSDRVAAIIAARPARA